MLGAITGDIVGSVYEWNNDAEPRAITIEFANQFCSR